MSFSADCCYRGVGEMYCKPYSQGECGDSGFGNSFGLNFGNPKTHQVNTLGQFLGNVSDFTISPTFERRQKIFRSGNFNASDCNTKIITGANISLTIECTNMENLTKAFCGEKKEYPICPTEVDCICWAPCPGPGGSIVCKYEAVEFEKPGIDEQSVEIKIINTDGSETDLVPWEDFEADCFMVRFLRDITLPLKSYFKISYKYGSKYTCIEGLSGQGSPVSLTFSGCNTASRGVFYRAKVHKVFFDPIDSFSFISDELQSITLNGTIEPVDKYRLKKSSFSQWFDICRIEKGAKYK